jgi:SAM-dependent methyltransferase
MDASAWDDRYRHSELVWSAGPNQFVVERTSGLVPGRALDLACGEGRNALWLAEQGWQVEAADFSEVAIEKARRIAGHRGIPVSFSVADAVTGEGLTVFQPFDLVLVAYLQLPDPDLDAALAVAASMLAPGGRLLVIGHHLDNLDRGHGGPTDPAVLHDPARIADHLRSVRPQLDLVHSGEVERTVDTPDGPRRAVDSLVEAVRHA